MMCELISHCLITALPNYHKMKDREGHQEQVGAEVGCATENPHASKWERQTVKCAI